MKLRYMDSKKSAKIVNKNYLQFYNKEKASVDMAEKERVLLDNKSDAKLMTIGYPHMKDTDPSLKMGPDIKNLKA